MKTKLFKRATILVSLCFLFSVSSFVGADKKVSSNSDGADNTLSKGSSSAVAAPASSRPNIILVVVDDLGYGDISAYNDDGKIFTPNVDRLASQGMMFTNGHTSASQCSPTRYGIVTGRYAWRTRLQTGVLPHFDEPLIDKGRMTIASMLKSQGYSTAVIGKWHLGLGWQAKDGETINPRSWGANQNLIIDYSKPLTSSPNDYGFDYYFGLNASINMLPYCFIENNKVVEIPDTAKYPVYDTDSRVGLVSPDYKTENVEKTLFSKAMAWLETQRKESPDKPFFLYYAMSAIHRPCIPSDFFIGSSKAGLRGDKVVEVDNIMGRLMNWLDKNNLTDNTIFIFTSDNGARPGDPRGAIQKLAANDYGQKYFPQDLLDYEDEFNALDVYNKPEGSRSYQIYDHLAEGPFKGYKSDIYEGGHRVPFIVRWPGVVKEGEVKEDMICTLDFLATFAAVVGVDLPANAGEDSYNMLPVLKDEKDNIRTNLVHKAWNEGKIALTSGDWKLIPFKDGGGLYRFSDVPEDGQLFNLKDDPYETTNLYNKNPKKVKELTDLLAKIKSGNYRTDR